MAEQQQKRGLAVLNSNLEYPGIIEKTILNWTIKRISQFFNTFIPAV